MKLHGLFCFRTTRLLLGIAFQTIMVAGPALAADGERQAAPQPSPIRIERHEGPPTIPKVARDEIICFALYTVQNGVMKMSAQLYPLLDGELQKVELQVKEDGTRAWKTIATSSVDRLGWQGTFRVENWDHSKDCPYRVIHSGGAVYEGLIRKDPSDKNEIVVAAFTGNSRNDRSPRTDIIENVKKQNPDLLFFSGDQSYDHKDHTAAWLLFGRQFGEIIKDRPTVTIPDDHDVGQGNLWGEGGKQSKLEGGSDGGYTMPSEYVNMVQRQQTWHLPDPYDPTPVEQEITVYYTSLNVGGIDFAILEDRKWKTGPAGLIPPMGPRPDHINDPTYDRSSIDLPEARLLGDRQLKFLRHWGQNWKATQMKVVLSQTIFGGGAHIHGTHEGRLLADLDSNGWPQQGRRRALYEMRRFFGFHLAGDQHLATAIHHGTESWEDCGWSFCVPSIVNYYGRWWWPEEEPIAGSPPNPGGLKFAGRHFDGMGNKITMVAYANPTSNNSNAAGHGIVRFNKTKRTIAMECWPRHVDIAAANAKQFAGWPITIHQRDNYGRKPIAWLPKLKIQGPSDPVVQIIDDDLEEPVYTLRIQGNAFRPPVFRKGRYTILIGEGKKTRAFKGVESVEEESDATLEVGLE